MNPTNPGCPAMPKPVVSTQLDEVFLYEALTPQDQVSIAKAFEVCIDILGKSRCWCIQTHSHATFNGFTTSHDKKILYRNRDARKLLLALSGRFYSDEKPVIVRKACCGSVYCLNPAHYYWGTRSDVAFENAQRTNARLNAEVVAQMRKDKEEGRSTLQISRKYKSPYHTVRRICNGEIYEEVTNVENTSKVNEIWANTLFACKKLAAYYPEEAKQFNLNYHVTNELECPWHKKGTSEHKGNFGLMGECLDCMEEIKSGRCTVDVKNFDYQWYWQVKRFWEQVDIKGDDECWPWLGATRRENSESIAYFPSPFHSAKTQSAPRVAFWLSRGYTGKYRIFNKKDCAPFCCNPTHLTIRELKGTTQPTEVAEICLNHGNIFQHYREANLQEQQDSSIELPSD